jgi:hypothetical protein
MKKWRRHLPCDAAFSEQLSRFSQVDQSHQAIQQNVANMPLLLLLALTNIITFFPDFGLTNELRTTKNGASVLFAPQQFPCCR